MVLICIFLLISDVEHLLCAHWPSICRMTFFKRSLKQGLKMGFRNDNVFWKKYLPQGLHLA